MTKVDVFSGFLGAGKTTLIKKMIKEAYSGEKLVLIENEFGEIGIDGGFLQEAGIAITEMNSGCICCSLVGDFNKALREVVEQFHPDRILIEPSGVGKLSDVIVAVERTVDECPELKLNSYVTVADASKVKVYMKNFGEFYNNQIEAAGTIILSRTQKLSQEKLEAAAALLREKNPDAAILTTPWDELDGKTILFAIEKVSLSDELLEKMRREHELEEAEHEHEHHHHDHEHDEHDEHDHEHEHHHDHGEDCDCGCHDHEHEHHHDGIDITYHDMSMIGSMAGVLNAAGYEEGEKILAGQLREIGRRVNEAGGIIGHIKFVLTAQGQSCQISVTDEDESIRRFTSNSCHVEGVAIVFNLEEDTLRAILRETLGSVLTVSGS